MLKKIFLLSVLLRLGSAAFSQDTLPKITVTLLGQKALVSWINPYQTVTGINIQRSGDSLRNFTTIGSALNVGAVNNGFLDRKDFLPNTQYYRLFVTFEGGNYLFTESHRGSPDTLKEIPSKIVVSQVDSLTSPRKVTPNTKKVQLYFVPSKHVYTGKDNNVMIAVKNAAKNKYLLKVFEDNGDSVFVMNKIPQDSLIIDRANFGHSGLFRFELYENKKLIETHKLYIPPFGKSMPLLDVNGYEFKNR